MGTRYEPGCRRTPNDGSFRGAARLSVARECEEPFISAARLGAGRNGRGRGSARGEQRQQCLERLHKGVEESRRRGGE